MKKAPSCSLVEVEPDVSMVDALEAPPFDDDTDSRKSKKNVRKAPKKKVILVETEVRRSPRAKANKMGFKDPVCTDKFCLGYSSKPPSLSNKAIKKISSSLCDIEAPLVSDEALGLLKKGGGPSPRKTIASKKKKKTKAPLVEDGVPKSSEDENKDHED